MTSLQNFVRDQTGAVAVEYGLLVGVIAVTALSATTQLGGAVRALFYVVANNLAYQATHH